MNKTLNSIVLASAIGLAGCGTSHSEYTFDGVIDGEYLKFYERMNDRENHLVVFRERGTKIHFQDPEKDNLVLDLVVITVNGNTNFYFRESENIVEKDAVRMVQRRFNLYLGKIEKAQTGPLYH